MERFALTEAEIIDFGKRLGILNEHGEDINPDTRNIEPNICYIGNIKEKNETDTRRIERTRK